MRVALSLLAFPALAAARSVADTIFGGWVSADVNPENTRLLTIALGGTSFSESVGSLRVRLLEVVSVCTQMVAGTNYFYNINGCRVTTPEGICPCTPRRFEVQIFEQTWTNTLEVTRIVDVERNGSSGMTCKPPATESSYSESKKKCTNQQPAVGEQELIDPWLEAMGLNKYGLDLSVVVPGGFYEQCPSFEYLLVFFPNHPWLLTAVDEEAECDNVEKLQIIAWINEKGLNAYGDTKGTPYKHDMPLKDESTGKNVTLCVYVRTKHPGVFPWLVKKEKAPCFDQH